MKKYIVPFLGLCLFITFIACDEDRFSPIVEIDIPKHISRLVVRADWSGGSDSLAVFVSKSRGVLDKTKTNFNQTYAYWNGQDSIRQVTEFYDTVPNTKVEILRNGQLLGTIPYFNKGYHLAKKLYKLDTIPGVTYTIRVSAPNFETVEASQKTQNRFIVLRGSYQVGGAISRNISDPFSSPEKGDEFSFELQDNASDENYYTLESGFRGQFFNGGESSVAITRDSAKKQYVSYGYCRKIDPNMEDNFLPDRTFNGKNYVWRFWAYPNYYFNALNGGGGGFSRTQLKSGDRVQANIRSSSKDYVLFLKTLDLAYSANDNPFFTEPVILYSNIKNGYGIFTIGSVQTVDFVIP
jgi:Domain of unknown function (DUF4249)